MDCVVPTGWKIDRMRQSGGTLVPDCLKTHNITAFSILNPQESQQWKPVVVIMLVRCEKVSEISDRLTTLQEYYALFSKYAFCSLVTYTFAILNSINSFQECLRQKTV